MRNFQKRDFAAISVDGDLLAYVSKGFLRKMRFLWWCRLDHPNSWPIHLGGWRYLVAPLGWYRCIRRHVKVVGLTVRVSHHTVLVTDTVRGQLVRSSFNQLGNNSIDKNERFLTRSDSIPTPQLLESSQAGPYRFTREQLVDGRELGAHEVTSTVISGIIEAIAPLYQKTQSIMKFDPREFVRPYRDSLEALPDDYYEPLGVFNDRLCEVMGGFRGCEPRWSEIHGDLTYRNVLQKDEEYFFIDGDRNEVLFPEIDAMLFTLYLNVFKQYTQPMDYNCYIEHFELLAGDGFRRVLDILYEKVPEFAGNHVYQRLMECVLLYRLVCLSLFNLLDPEDIVVGAQLLTAANRLAETL